MATPMLTHALAQLLQDIRVRAQLVASVSDRVAITRDLALYSVAFHSKRRGFDLSFNLGSQLLQLPESAWLIFFFILVRHCETP